MPVSHLGLSVSHIPSAISFYLAALEPIGYRYIGNQGETIGLGVESADFFLSQAPNRSRVSPNHIAFSADSSSKVRECYTAALKAGGYPSGPPSYRNDDCSCFNAAVEDLDGNTIEFIFRQPHKSGNKHPTIEDDVKSRWTSNSKVSNPRSRMQTVADLASRTSKSIQKSDAPSPGIPRSYTAPASTSSDQNSKRVIGTVLGAAAGAAIAFAMCKSESGDSKMSARHYSARESKYEAFQGRDEQRSSYIENEPDEMSRSPPSSRSARAIEDTRYRNDTLQDIIRQETSPSRISRRSRTYDPSEFIAASRYSRSGRQSMKRASTLPLEIGNPNYYLEARESTTSSRMDIQEPSAHSGSHRSSRRRRNSTDTSDLKRHDSGLSVHSSRSRHQRTGDSGRQSSTSKIRPSGRETRRRHSVSENRTSLVERSTYEDHDTAQNGSTIYSNGNQERRSSSKHEYPARASTSTSKSKLNSSKISRAIRSGAAPKDDPLWEDLGAESDGLSDLNTIVPDDSISCIDLSKPKPFRRRESPSGNPKARSRLSEPDGGTRRSARRNYEERSVATAIPLRPRNDQKERR